MFAFAFVFAFAFALTFAIGFAVHLCLRLSLNLRLRLSLLLYLHYVCVDGKKQFSKSSKRNYLKPIRKVVRNRALFSPRRCE